MRSTLFTILGFTIAACAAETPGGPADPSDPSNPSDPSDPSDPTDPNNPGSGTTAAQVLEKISNTECDQAFTCKSNFPTDAGVTFAQEFGASTTECYTLNAMYWDATAIQASITAGKITFDQAAADACMSGAVTAPVCTTFWTTDGPGLPDACWDTFQGTVAQGGACTIDFECSGELYCGDAGTCAMDTATGN